MRLIDADALADALFEKRKNYPQWVADTIGAMPDAIVRCKDCIDRRVCAIAKRHDGFTYNKFDPDWFCADGERKDENAEPGKDA